MIYNSSSERHKFYFYHLEAKEKIENNVNRIKILKNSQITYS